VPPLGLVVATDRGGGCCRRRSRRCSPRWGGREVQHVGMWWQVAWVWPGACDGAGRRHLGPAWASGNVSAAREGIASSASARHRELIIGS
jgi:hypothetical protein